MSADRLTKALTVLLAATLLLAGCARPVEISQSEEFDLLKHISYAKDSHGICYAMLSSMGHGGFASTSLTAIPCDKAGL